MKNFQYSDKSKQRIEEFLRRREAQPYRRLGRLYQTSVYAMRQYAQAAQSPPIREPEDSEVIEGTFVVVGSASDGSPRQKRNRIKALRQALYRLDARIISAWVLSIIIGYFGGYSLALDLLRLAGELVYLKLFREVQALIPIVKNFLAILCGCQLH